MGDDGPAEIQAGGPAGHPLYPRATFDLPVRRIPHFLLLAGVVSLSYWSKVGGVQFALPRRAESVFLFAIIAAGAYFLINRRTASRFYLRTDVVLLSTTFLAFALLATLVAAHRYRLPFGGTGVANLLKILLGILVFIFAFALLHGSSGLYRWLCWAFMVPPILLIPFLFMPALARRLGLLSPDGVRFEGFTSNPAHLALLVTISFSFVIVFGLFALRDRRSRVALWYLLLALGLAGLVFWSQTRAFQFALVPVILLATALHGFYSRKPAVKMVGSVVFLIALMTMAVLLLPASDRALLAERAIQASTGDSRLSLTAYYLSLIPSNPLGLGLNFQEQFVLVIDGRAITMPHSWLDLWVYAGIGGLASFLLLLLFTAESAARNLRAVAAPHARYFVGALTALAALLFGSLFTGSPVSDYAFWVLLATVLSPPRARLEPEHEESRPWVLPDDSPPWAEETLPGKADPRPRPG